MENFKEFKTVVIKVPNIKPLKNIRNCGLMVSQFNKQGEFIQCFNSTRDAAYYICNFKHTTNYKSIMFGINKACGNNKLKTIYGYQWRYTHPNGEIVKKNYD